MDENEVVDSVCRYLESKGCEISTRLTTKQTGIDIVAVDQVSKVRFSIEAKGGTSSREGSARYGLPYTASQVFDRVSKGVFTCLRLRSKYNGKNQRIILAVPESTLFEGYIDSVVPVLKKSRIEVWLVSEDDRNIRELI